MARVRVASVGLVICGFLVMTSAASALTLGNTTIPSGATTPACSTPVVYWQSATDSSYQYSVPGGGAITSWSTNTTGDPTSGSVMLVVLRPSGSSYTVVGVDNQTFPNPAPASGVATFNVAQPIPVATGDVLGLWSSASSYDCAFRGSSIPPAEVLSGALASSTPSVGATYTAAGTTPSALLNVSANLVQTQDLALAGGAAPSPITAGGGAAYAFTVVNGGPGSGPITFTDTVPAGLKIVVAAAGYGSCTTAGQAVTCTITGLAAGTTAPVFIIVSAVTAGSYVDIAQVSPTDPTPADNSATATLTVTAPTPPPVPACHVIRLAGAPLALAKTVIRALNCTVGKTKKKSSKKYRKGYVISTRPGSGTHAAGTKVGIVVSSGPPKKHKRKRK